MKSKVPKMIKSCFFFLLRTCRIFFNEYPFKKSPKKNKKRGLSMSQTEQVTLPWMREANGYVKPFRFLNCFVLWKPPAYFFSKEIFLELNPEAFQGKFNKQMLSWPKRILCYAYHEESHDRRFWMPARPGYGSSPRIAWSRTELPGSQWEEINAPPRAEKIEVCWINILDHKSHSKKILSMECQPKSGYIILI